MKLIEKFFVDPPTLVLTKVTLIPLSLSHSKHLLVAGADARIWEFMLLKNWNEHNVENWIEEALKDQDKKKSIPFVIKLNENNEIIGATRFMCISIRNDSLEIGWTWMSPKYWGTSINLECKLALLRFSFEELKMVRVFLRTDITNIRSQRAIEKLGAKKEGIARKQMLRPDGTYRDSVYYSIIDEEWTEIKQNIKMSIKNISDSH